MLKLRQNHKTSTVQIKTKPKVQTWFYITFTRKAVNINFVVKRMVRKHLKLRKC